MNRFLAIALLAAVSATAHASPGSIDGIRPTEPFNGVRDRAEVKRELREAKTVANPSSITYNPLATFQSSQSRAQVRAEFLNNRNDVAGLYGEDSGSFQNTLPSDQATSGG